MKMTKKAKILASSVAAIALSSSLIAGSTFALFTSDSSVNIAVSSAKVKVAAAVDKTSVKVSSTLGTAYVQTSFDENDNLVLDNIASGDSVSVKINVTNYSTISVLYKAKVTVTDIKDGSLSDVLEVSTASENGVSYDGLWRTLPAASDENGDSLGSVTVTISLPEEVTDHMAESCKVAFSVEAVQGNAPVTGRAVSNENELEDALKVGGTVVLEKDIELSEKYYADVKDNYIGEVEVCNDAVLDLNGHTLSGAVYTRNEGGDKTINLEIKNGTVNTADTYWRRGLVAFGNVNAVITDVHIEGSYWCLYAASGASITVNGGKFECTQKVGMLNVQNNSGSSIVVTGGTYKNYDPSKGDDYHKGTFLADGYGVVSSVDENGDTWYKVVEAYKEVERDFTNAEETKQLFCPDCFNKPGSDHNEHTTLGDSVIVDEERGVLQVVSESAFTTFDADWADYKYTLSNNVDLSNLKDGEFIIFSSGLTNPYLNDLLVAIKKVDGKLYVRSTAGDFTPNENDYVLSSDNIECVWSYETDENGKLVASVVVDGHIVSSTNNVLNVKAEHKIQWQIYLVPEANKGTGNALAEISNFKLVAELK